jgi:hypothetical protein
VEKCLACGKELPLPTSVRIGRPPQHCGLKCRRRKEFWQRKARRWLALAAGWRAQGALASAERCETIAKRLAAKGVTAEPEAEGAKP